MLEGTLAPVWPHQKHDWLPLQRSFMCCGCFRDKPALMWQAMNVCTLEYPDESFNSVIDKGTLDSVLCGEGSTANVAKMCMEISRVLKPNGVYFVCSYGVPDNRLQVRTREVTSIT